MSLAAGSAAISCLSWSLTSSNVLTISGSMLVTRTITGPNWPSTTPLTPSSARPKAASATAGSTILSLVDQAEIDVGGLEIPFGDQVVEGLAGGECLGRGLGVRLVLEDDLLDLAGARRGEAVLLLVVTGLGVGVGDVVRLGDRRRVQAK